MPAADGNDARSAFPAAKVPDLSQYIIAGANERFQHRTVQFQNTVDYKTDANPPKIIARHTRGINRREAYVRKVSRMGLDESVRYRSMRATAKPNPNMVMPINTRASQRLMPSPGRNQRRIFQIGTGRNFRMEKDDSRVEEMSQTTSFRHGVQTLRVPTLAARFASGDFAVHLTTIECSRW